MNIFRNIMLTIVILIFTGLLAAWFGKIYGLFFNIPTGSGFAGFIASPKDYVFFDGLTPAYVFLLTLVSTAWGVGKKYWWMGVLLLPALAFVLYFDLTRIWFYFLIGLVGWAIGYGINKLLKRSNHST